MIAAGDYDFDCPLPDRHHRREKCNGSLNVTVKPDGKVLMRCRRNSCASRPGWIIELAHVVDADNDTDLKVNFERYLGKYKRRSSSRPQVDVEATLRPQRIQTFKEQLLGNAEALHYVLAQREFTFETLDRYHVGYAAADDFPLSKFREPAITFPVFDGNGIAVNLYRRFLGGHIKWMGLGPSSALYPCLPDKDLVVVGEGVSDGLTLWQAGQAIGFSGLASTAGAAVKWPLEWLPCLDNRLVAIVYDCEPLALQKAHKLAAMLRASHWPRDVFVVDLAALSSMSGTADVSDYVLAHGGEALKEMLWESYTQHRRVLRRERSR